MATAEKLLQVQKDLKAPKSNYNDFGKYHYRSCEDITEAAKPLLSNAGLLMTITDDLVMIGERYYVKATVTICDVENTEDAVSVTALARESEKKKGMDASQITGAASSYARKYALNGIFAIDDTKDADAMNKHGKGNGRANSNPPPQQEATPKNTDSNRVSKAQLNKIFAMVGDIGMDAESAKAQMASMFNVESSKEMTKQQASQFIDWLEMQGEVRSA